ncbi:MAG: PQQ-binding-like beta-propeller repeat protein [Bacteroidota bacterium]|nr:PQQ-binding-like beta-propeller repeat protein [Bacteroidota bacterium]
MNKYLQYIIFFSLFIIAGLFFGRWLFHDPTNSFVLSKPGMDNVGIDAVERIKVNIGEFFEKFRNSNTPGNGENWPRFRGACFDNISKANIKLINKFPEKGPEIIWQHQLGEGHAGAAIFDGLVYILDYDEEKRADMLRCFTLAGGIENWRRWYKNNLKRNHGLSRTVPAVTQDYIVSIGPRCHVMCVERKTGNFLWGIDIEKEYGSEIPLWYTGQCPLIDNGVAIIATGGKSLMIGVDCKTGKILWETPNPNNWKMSHASIMPFEFEEEKIFVYPAIGGICGIGANEKNIGKVLWETTEWDHNVVAPSAVCMPDGKIFLTAGYGAGSMILQLSKSDGNYQVRVLDEYKPVNGLACEQQTPVFWQGHLFGVLPKDAGHRRNQFVCVNPNNCREIVSESGKVHRFGLGPYLFADGKFWLLKDDGTLVIIEASTRKYKQLDEFKLLNGHDAWAPLALADGYLVLRDSKTLMCVDIREK